MFGQGAAIDRHKGLSIAMAVDVDRASDQLLARAAGPADQHIDFRIGNLLYRVKNSHHRRTLADDIVKAVLLVELLFEVAVFLPYASFGQHFIDHDTEVFRREGLGHEVGGPQPHGLDRILDRGEGRHHHRLDLRMLRVDPFEQFHTPHTRHFQVGDHQVRLFVLDILQGFFCARGSADFVAFALEEALATQRQVYFVLND